MSLRALQIATTGVLAHRAQLEVASNNVANVNTTGYARRRVLLTSLESVGNFAGDQSGLGVRNASVERMGDRLLEAQVNLELGRLGTSDVLADALADVESIVAGESGTGLLDPLNALFDAFADVAADPGALTPRNMVIAPAETLSDALSRVDGDLKAAMERNDSDLIETVERINELAKQVAALNGEIGANGGSSTALELEEQRSIAIRELATLCGAVGISRENGTVDVLIGGHYLVQAEATREVELVADPTYASLHTVSFAGQTPPGQLEGELSGLLQARSEGIAAARDDLNTFAAVLADTINAVHRAGYGLDGTTGLDLFVYDAASPAATLQLNPLIAANPSLFAAASAPGEPGNGDNALALEDLRTEVPVGLSATLLDTHTDYLAAVGHQVKTAQAARDARYTVAASLEARYQETAGVSLDEEAISLAAAQSAYAASQRAFQVALEVIDSVLSIS